MEQARLIIAIALSFLVFILWEFLFVPKEAPRPVEPEKTTRITDAKKEKTAEVAPTPEPYQTAAEAEKPPVAAPLSPKLSDTAGGYRHIVVSTPLYRAQISEKGAGFVSFTLNKFRQTVQPDSPFYQMVSPELDNGNLKLQFSGLPEYDFNNAGFKTDLNDTEFVVRDASRSIVFTWQSSQGVMIEKKYTFAPDSYVIGLEITIKNRSSRAVAGDLHLSLLQHLPIEKRMYGFRGPCALMNQKLIQVDLDDIDEENRFTGEFAWVAIVDRYFMTSLIPEPAGVAEMQLNLDKNNLLTNRYVRPQISIAPQKQETFAHHLFIGPKSVELLQSTGFALDKAVNFGWFDFIAKPCLWLMNIFYSVVPNYGIAIIVLTVLTKLIMWPLGNKSYKSMAEMKKLQPLMAEIKEKYKGDKKRINEETMRLYKTYKVNPMGGCLPMIVQIPVFFALYRMLYEAVELRHAPFFGWINDLSAPDRLFQFSTSIPLMEPPYGIPVLTIVMGGTMFLQQKMSPPIGDATQAKIMMFMPIMFTFIFINFSSGLVLYWLVNNVISIAQQYYIQKKNT